MKSAEYWIEKLEMIKHPEGGYFKETYRSDESIDAGHLPGRYEGSRSFGTSIYFLLTTESVSNFHRLQSDEIWHFHQGGVAKIHFITEEGQYYSKDIGPDLEKGQSLQVIIPRNTWFAAEVIEEHYILVGCTVSPGFEFEDFELAEGKNLKGQYPEYTEVIERFS